MCLEFAEGLAPPSKDAENERQKLEADWRKWVPEMFPGYVSDDDGHLIPFAPHHEEFWEKTWSIESGVRPAPGVYVWGRGQAKSTNVEMAAVSLGARRIVRYVLYVCGTQDQADDHVANIGDMLEKPTVAHYYPELGRPMVGKFGQSKGWRRNRLRTSSGFTIDAIGLDTARSRGAKLEDARPDLIIFDDLDDESDTETTVLKKIRAITRKILPAGADDLAVIAVQNLVHENSIFSRLVDGHARFLADRVVSGPVPVIEDLEYQELDNGKARITGGKPTWDGMDLDRCQRILYDEGLEAFLVERQHQTGAPLGSLIYRRSRVDAAIQRGTGVEYDPSAEQILALDPGYSKRAALLAIQEGAADKIEVWKEYSFTRCDDDYVARIAARHMVDCRVTLVYYDAEDPGIAAAIKKHYKKLCRQRNMKPRARFQRVAFGTWKRYAIKITRWLLDSPRIAFGANETEVHVADDLDAIQPGIFHKEMRNYQVKPGTEDPQKEKDHGPDAFHCYAIRWIAVWVKDTKQKKVPKPAEAEAA